jgi:hypothetical protein
MFRHVSQGGQTLGNNVSATKIELGKHEMFLNLIGNISASREANCVCACNDVSTGGQTQKHLRKHDESQCFRNNVS